jgi:hypothetical protein
VVTKLDGCAGMEGALVDLSVSVRKCGVVVTPTQECEHCNEALHHFSLRSRLGRESILGNAEMDGCCGDAGRMRRQGLGCRSHRYRVVRQLSDRQDIRGRECEAVMFKALAAVALLVGCTDEPVQTAPDAGMDAYVSPLCPDLSANDSFRQQIGECCTEAAPLCATGAGACVEGACVRQCDARSPLCPDGTDGEKHTRVDGSTLCVCP